MWKHDPTCSKDTVHTRTVKNLCRFILSFTWTYLEGVRFSIVRSTLLLVVVLCWVDVMVPGCYTEKAQNAWHRRGSLVLLSLFCLLCVTKQKLWLLAAHGWFVRTPGCVIYWISWRCHRQATVAFSLPGSTVWSHTVEHTNASWLPSRWRPGRVWEYIHVEQYHIHFVWLALAVFFCVRLSWFVLEAPVPRCSLQSHSAVVLVGHWWWGLSLSGSYWASSSIYPALQSFT